MKQKGRQLLAFLMVTLLWISIGCYPVKAEAVNLSQMEAETIQQNKAVVISVEAFTLGQGFVSDPVVVNNAEGHTVDEILYTVLGDRVGPPKVGYYLSMIEQADTGMLNIPVSISSMPAYKNCNAPSNDTNDGNDDYPALGEYSYSKLAGWLYSVNNQFPPKGMHDYILKAGDVVRVQFSVYGYGADLGNLFEENQSFALICANKDKLISTIAFMNMHRNDWLSVSENQLNYNNGISLICDISASQQSVDECQKQLGSSPCVSINEVEVPKEPNPSTPDKPTDPTDQPTQPSVPSQPGEPVDPNKPSEPVHPSEPIDPGQSDEPGQPDQTVPSSGIENPTANPSNPGNSDNHASDNKIKLKKANLISVKKKKSNVIQLKWKRVTNASGYQIYRKDSSKGKYKKVATIKSGKTLQYSDKKMKSNKTYYYKIRAYKKVSEKSIYGAYSNTKKMKLKK